MNLDKLLTYYWDIFVSHLCEFHSLEKSFIERNEYELDWNSLSKNKSIDWDVAFLRKYESRFSWGALASNESILWTADKVETFKKRLDWHNLGLNKNLPITEDFVQKYSKRISVTESNPLLNKSLIEKYKIKVLPALVDKTQDIKQIKDDEVESVLTNFRFLFNQKSVYECVFNPLINEYGIEHIFKRKFDHSQRYYFLLPLHHDIHGLTPEFQIDGHNPFNDFKEGRGLMDISEKLVLINGSLQEGPARLYEIPRFSSFSYYTTLLVSENVRAVLDQFRLPAHTYHEVDLRPKKLTTTTKFYILQLEFDTLNKDLDYSNRTFYYSYNDFKNCGHGQVTDQITNYDELVAVNARLKQQYSPNGYGVKIRAEKFLLRSEFDMYSFTVHGQIIINQFLKAALEKNFPDQIGFRSAQSLNIKIDQNKFDNKAKLTVKGPSASKVNSKTSEEDKYFYAKVDRLEKSDIPLDKFLLKDDKFATKELELNVIFPKSFKDRYLDKRWSINGYDFLPISKFYIQSEYADRFPETYKSVVVAENGVGDTISLILERNSDHQLQDGLFEFFHETGEYEEKIQQFG